ncbi:MAG: NUDIX domain-containing protein [Planctomycetes bacterium]|nr:NUDIX domain-containing protein [Planctomycetota bacterium]
MEQKWAAGVILAHDDDGTWKFLLLQNSRHGTWGFAKGHAESGEDEITAARREVQEETGISEYQLVDGFHETYDYDVNTESRGAYRKKVHYFLATVAEQTFDGSEEHSDARWLGLEEASKLIKHKQTLLTLKKAATALRV